jgi:hypothetical protein
MRMVAAAVIASDPTGRAMSSLRRSSLRWKAGGAQAARRHRHCHAIGNPARAGRCPREEIRAARRPGNEPHLRLVNQKGGVGGTTTAISLGAHWRSSRQQVLRSSISIRRQMPRRAWGSIMTASPAERTTR